MQRRVAGVSRQELERRWTLVREALAARNIDVLVLCGGDNLLGGYVRWFTDAPVNYRKVVAFFAGDLMTVIEHGASGSVRRPNGDDDDYPGVGEVVSVAEFPSVHYCQDFEATELVQRLKARGVRTVALVNEGAMPYRLVSSIRGQLSGVTFHDLTDVIDDIKAIKSEEEVALIREGADVQDKIFARLLSDVRPGMRDHEVAVLVQSESRRRGGEGGVLLAGSAPVGEPAFFQAEYKQGRVLKEGDQLSVLIENSGPGGYFLELVRPIVLGRASGALLEAFEIVREAQDNTLAMCKPGTAFADIHRAHNRFMQRLNQPADRRLYAHGQGYDIVERPLVREDETMIVKPGMCLTVHPSYGKPGLWATITDNYMIGPKGAGDCLHRTEKRVFEI